MNTTFLPFGKEGSNEYRRMIDLDRDIRSSGAGTYMDWGNYRGGSFGGSTQSKWDLVSLAIEANEDEEVPRLEETLLSLTDAELPEIMRGKSMAEKLAIVKEQLERRQSLEEKITELREKRAAFVEEELRNLSAEGEKTFSEAIKKVLLKQLKAKGFSITN